ncbi:hypothetical protein BDZ91DRAFT_759370 [Kalaharituber pfeilii]|nr:hypothetical protein BDZ91DRAFT_759370 [Kalaharituber pfeilii]
MAWLCTSLMVERRCKSYDLAPPCGATVIALCMLPAETMHKPGADKCSSNIARRRVSTGRRTMPNKKRRNKGLALECVRLPPPSLPVPISPVHSIPPLSYRTLTPSHSQLRTPPTSLAKHTNLSGTRSRQLKKRFKKAPGTTTRAPSDSSTRKHAAVPDAYALGDDTPKAFTRLITSMQNPSLKRKRGGEEDTGERQRPKPTGAPGSKKRKRSKKSKSLGDGADGVDAQKQPPHKLEILPHESLREFNRRVDQVMRINFKGTKRRSSSPGSKPPQQQQSLSVDEEEEEDDYSDYTSTSSTSHISTDSRGNPIPRIRIPRSRPHRSTKSGGGSGGGAKGKRRIASPDPWAQLAESRGKIRYGETVKPREVLKIKGGGGGSGGVGMSMVAAEVPRKVKGTEVSAARREMLGAERESVVARYRELMARGRGEG